MNSRRKKTRSGGVEGLGLGLPSKAIEVVWKFILAGEAVTHPRKWWFARRKGKTQLM